MHTAHQTTNRLSDGKARGGGKLTAALGWSRCATGAGAASRFEALARLVAQHQNLAKRRTELALLSHGYLRYSVASDANLLETSRGLGTGGAGASRHRGQQRATGGESKERCCSIVVCVKSREKLDLGVFLVVDHDYDLKNRCLPGRF